MVTTIRLPDELHRDLKRQAGRKGMTFNAYLLNILWGIYKKQAESEEREWDENENSINTQERSG